MLISLLGLFSGLLMGVTGGGGAIVSIPILIYGLHIPIKVATTLSLVVVGGSALIGTAIRRKDVYWRKGFVFAILGSLASPVGVLAAKAFSEPFLIGSFSILMLFVATLMAKKSFAAKKEEPLAVMMVSNGWQDFRNILPIALFTGFLTGLFGVGGGFMIVPALVLLGKINNRSAVATSLFVIFLISLSSIFGKLSHVTLDITLTSLFLAGSISGMFIGSAISKKISNRLSQRVFAFIAACLGIYMLIDSITKFILVL